MTVGVLPSLVFTVANRATACNGESNFISGAGSATAVDLGRLAVSSNASGAQALTVNSNAGGGFTVYTKGAEAAANLRSAGHNWVDVVGAYPTGAALGANERFGYTFSDSTTSSTVTNPTSGNFIQLDNTNRAIMGSTTSTNGSGCIAFDAQSGSDTPAGTYAATVIYTVIPSF